jgi:hypothetical protein
MDYAYTLKLLSDEFRALTPSWNIYPRICVHRDSGGVVIHESDVDSDCERKIDSDMLILPPRIQEPEARGTEINLETDQTFLLQYWAHANQTAKAGVHIHDGGITIEYWLPIHLEPIADETPEEYVNQVKLKCFQALAPLSLFNQFHMTDVMNRFAFRMKYQGNELRIWFVREGYRKGLRPLAEQTFPKDRWIGPGEFEVVTFSSMEKAAAPQYAEAPFGGNITEGDFVPNPEIPGGNIALIEQNNNRAQKPLETLVQMHAHRETQVAVNDQIDQNRGLISAMNSGMPEVLRDFNVDQAYPVHACVNVAHEMRKGWQSICGQV